ncbi:serine/threonine protein kinase [Polytolypa hystricis UAMH7299]|uniref:non-specific serine/threonine protein kinase n=1 Tax=Polytolypa hystricis (strain UAMH7299) TaxID=1447883 RepID=A0A2B7Y6V6_POLH7|nr:serine/threonine protein kinase [Polytolypa hystricis UAMH7299]
MIVRIFPLRRPSGIPRRFNPVALGLANLSPFSPRRQTPSRGMESTAAGKTAFQYIPLEDVEKLERYCPGGFHPVTIGDNLHGRDQTVGRYVAVKIVVAAGDSLEGDILHQLGGADLGNETHPGKDLIPPILDEFILKEPNGEHRCLVTAPARMSIATAKDASYITLFQLPVAGAIAAQLIQAVDFLHSRGIVHADLHPGNILLRLPKDMDNLSFDQFYEKYRQPNLEPVVRLDNQPLPRGVPTHGIIILLTDFGESFLPSTTLRHYSRTPELLIPPEIHFLPQELLSFSADIWTLAGTIWAIIGQRPLFEGFGSSADLVTKEHVDVLGKLPPEWWVK